jgi:hypothetical protein
MQLSCSLSIQLQTTMIRSLQLTGGATSSIFPQVELLLNEDIDHQHAIEYVAFRKRAKKYRSVIDFLFCELYPEWRKSCYLFYADKGPQLKKMMSKEDLARYNWRLLKAVEIAYKLYKEKRRASWNWFCQQVNEAISEAA